MLSDARAMRAQMPRVASKFTVRNACSGRPAITVRCARAVVGVSQFQRAALLCSSAAVSMGASRTRASCAIAGRKVSVVVGALVHIMAACSGGLSQSVFVWEAKSL
jgi:hypothetical protein